MQLAGMWALRSTDFPDTTLSFPITYDGARQRVIAVVAGKTHEWDGTTWTEVASFGPQARGRSGALVYRGSAGASYLFGGRVDKPVVKSVADPWEWNGCGWMKLPEFGPRPRHHHAMAHDGARDRVVLFGGQADDDVVGDTWEWDGLSWTPFAAGPHARIWHAMAYDANRQRTVLFGGSSNTDVGLGVDLGDTWEWDGRAWTQLAEVGPLPRRRHAMVFEEGRGRVLLYGGERDEKTKNPEPGAQDFVQRVSLGDTWEWDGRHWTQISDTGPGPRVDHGMAYDKARARVVLCGGGKLDTWEWTSSAVPPHLSIDAAVSPGVSG
jgi:hypothetical protein